MNPTYEEIEAKIALLEMQLKLSEAAERAWESSMMQACGEDGPKSVADKFAELESKLEAALRECRSAGITIDNLEAKCAALAAENAWLKAICDDRRTFIMNGVQLGFIKVPTVETDPALETIRVAVSPQEQTPATDAFLAEVRAKAFDDLCAAFVKHASVSGLDDGDCVTVKEATDALLHCAEQLHKGVHS